MAIRLAQLLVQLPVQLRGADTMAIAADKEAALHQFWSGFGWTAKDENTIPDNAMTLYGNHYITYSVATAALGVPVLLSGDLWCRDTSWSEITAEAEQIAQALPEGDSYLVPFSGGYLRVYRGSPFTQRIGESHDTFRRIHINIIAEYLSAY